MLSLRKETVSQTRAKLFAKRFLLTGVLRCQIKKHGDVDSIVPVLVYTRGMTVQQAIADTTTELSLNIARFDRIATDLLAQVKSTSPDLTDEIVSYVQGCRYNQMANLLWRYVRTCGIAIYPMYCIFESKQPTFGPIHLHTT